MPIAAAIPAVPPVPGETLVGRKIVLAVVEDGGSQLNFRGKVANWTRNQQEPLKRTAPNSSLSNVVDRTVRRGGANDVWVIDLDEPRNANVLAQWVNKADFHGQFRIWVLDPDDNTGSGTQTAAWLSDEFPGTSYFGGSMGVNDEGFNTLPVTIHVDGITTFDADQSVASS